MRSGKRKKTVSRTPAQVCRVREEKIFHRRSVKFLLRKILVIAAALALVLYFVFGVSAIEDQNMYPLMQDGDLVFYYKLNQTISIGDVVTFKKDGIRYFGRVAAQAGDQVDMSDEGDLMVNGNAQSERVLYPTYKTDALTKFPCQVGEDEVFLLGDMRTGAVDSRDYGSVSLNEIDGVVFSVIKRRNL